MNAVRVLITPELLCQILKFPEGARISAADTHESYVVLTVEHPDLPLVANGSLPSTACPVYQKNYRETEPKVEFVEWGYETTTGGGV